jgi:hypothetical protein
MKRYIKNNSIEYDSEGNALTPEQSAFFKDSKIRDNQGRLLVCYHGSTEQFDTFKINYDKYSHSDKPAGVYFAPRKLPTQYYSEGKHTYKCYLNCKNPKIVHRPDEQDGDVSGYDSLIALSIDPWDRRMYNYETNAVEVDHTDAKGIIEIIAFYPNQVKSITNKCPTDSSNINASTKRYISSAIMNIRDIPHSVKLEFLADPDLDVDVLKLLSEDIEPSIRARVAGHPNTPEDILRKLSTDSNSSVRFYIGQNPHTPTDVLSYLYNDNDFEVKRAIIKNHNTPVDLLEQAAQGRTQLRALLSNPNVPRHIFEELANDKDAEIRYIVAGSLNTPLDILHKLECDEDWDVSDAAMRTIRRL